MFSKFKKINKSTNPYLIGILFSKFLHSPSNYEIDVYHLQFGNQFLELYPWKSFCENINHLKTIRSVDQIKYPFFNLLFNKVTIYFNIFGSIMIVRNLRLIQPMVITLKGGWIGWWSLFANLNKWMQETIICKYI